MQLPEGKSRLDLVRAGITSNSLAKRGRLVVSIERLREDPHNERKTFRNMEGLIASVREHGIVEPITVNPDGDNFLILTGHRRYRAARAAGLSQVEVLIREPESESHRRLKSLISNVQRENLGVLEMAEALQSMLSEGSAIGSKAELARRIGKSRQWVSEMLQVLALSPKLQQRVRTSEQTLAYDTVMKIAHLDNEHEQGRLIDAALKGESVAAIREKVRAAHKRDPKHKRNDRRTERVQETLNGYTAVVSGPVGPDAERHMRAVVKALGERLLHGLN